jgi:dTMP kinase
MRRGRIIAFEGIDGSGKTTISNMLYHKMRKQGIPIYYTFEPTYTRVGSIIQKTLRGDLKVSPALLALMFASDRVNHFETEIWPLVCDGINVIVDRYIHSSIAYQGAALRDDRWVRVINNRVPPPDLSLYIDIEPSEAIERLMTMRKVRKPTIFEKARFLTEVRAIYTEMVDRGELVKIDGNGNKGQVLSMARKMVATKLGI